jgi:cytochrome c2
MTGAGRQRGSVLARVLLFSLTLTLVFTLVANLLPQVEGEAPVEKEIDLGALTMDSFVALGESIFKGKGTCTLCHNSMGRAPDILVMNMVEIARERLADPRYQGKAETVEEYLHESMVEPSIYVVKGFGKKGSNDTVSPMPVVDKPPIQLSEVEMNAVIAFLEAKDGNEVGVPLPEGLPETGGNTETGPEADAVAEPAATPEQALNKHGCTACHAIADSRASLGPDLRTVGARLDAASIRQSIIDPNAVVAEGFDAGLMPTDFANKMTVSELEMIVEYLSAQKGGQ